MRDFSGMHDGEMLISEDTDVHGMIVGNLIVPSGRRLILHGMVDGDLLAQKGAQVEVYGMVSGIIRNDDANVEIFGMVGAVNDVGATKSKISKEARVTGAN